MKTRIFFAITLAAAVFLSGCAAPRQNSRPVTPAKETPKYFVPASQVGWVAVDIDNPSLLRQEVLVFEGGTSVQMVPDSRTGGWMYSRPALAHFVIGGANSSSNWHQYERLMLPRNASFTLVSRTLNLWGAGPPEFYSFRVGSDPYAVRYTRIAPSYPQANAGAVVLLTDRPAAPFGNGPLNIEYVIDMRLVGQAFTGAATKALFPAGR